MARRAWGLAAAGALAWAAAHPGTWEGQVIMNEDGAPLPDLSGLWADSSAKDVLVLQLYQPPDEAAAPPNSTYSVNPGTGGRMPPAGICRLTATYSYTSRNRTGTLMHCETTAGAEHPTTLGSLPGAGAVRGGDLVDWGGGRRWSRRPMGVGQRLGRLSGVHTVHVVFMNHYDVGYTDYINGVDNTYMHKYYPLAAATAESTRANGSFAPFKYTTHPWLMERYLQCPCPDAPCLATSLGNPFEDPLKCASPQEIANFSAAARRGDIVWNAAPFNVQPENMAPELFAASFGLARDMDQRFGRPAARTVSIRDVMYVTRAALPHLKAHGITGLTIGSNGAGVPPQVPKLHRWLDAATQTDVVVAYHPYGYGGYGLKDCAEAPNGVALCTEFRTDNTGPPSTLKEVTDTLGKVQQEYPGATVKPSTFDGFMAEVMPVKDQLPTVELEAADTWTYGTASDPLKMAQHRAIQRAWIRCLRRGDARCSPADPAIRNMTFFLLKAPEHTWGTPGISGWGGSDDYNVTSFRANLSSKSYLRAAESWAEQRLFNELAVRALQEAEHPLALEVREELEQLERVSAPDLGGLHAVPLTTLVQLNNGVRVGFRADGAITALEDGGIAWASASSPLAGFVYQTFNDTEWMPFTYSYLNDHQPQTGFCKPGSNNFSESALWYPRLERLMVNGSTDAASSVILDMAMPTKAWKTYGAPRTVFLQVTPTPEGVDLTFTTLGKMPTMIGEATMVTFRPAPPLARPAAGGSAWQLQKLGQLVDPEGVLDGGNQYTHGVWPGAIVQTEQGSLAVESLDAAIMNPITDDFPVGNPLPASYKEAAARAGTGTSRLSPGSVRGMAANLHNNLWNTNYPLYYPYFDPRFCSTPLNCSDSHSLWRFRLLLGRRESRIVV